MAERSVVASSPPGSFWRRRGPRIGLVLVLALAAGVLAWKPATKLWHRVEQRYVRWRVDRFLNQAGEATRAERPRVALAALESAAALAPGDWGIRIARADVLFAMGSAEEAEALWNRWLEEAESNDPRRLPVVYAGKLLAAGRFETLARLGCRQLAKAGADFGLWLNVAAEAGALCSEGLLEKDLSAIADLVVRDVVTAYWRARARRLEEASALLVKGDRLLMRPAVALLSARTWVLAGDRPRARLALAQSARGIDPLEALAQQPVTEELDGPAARRIVQALLSPRVKEEAQMRLLLTFVLHGLGDSKPEAADEMLEILKSRVSRLEASQIAALWLYAGSGGAIKAEQFWRELIGQRNWVQLPVISFTERSSAMIRLLVALTPMPIEFSVASIGLFSGSPSTKR